ncbi:V-type ATP synthase subunit F [Cellulomonas soli]|uniref:V-type ATP synthase subunit F n=1 Tax=Cellulomonas soli TaxID=931535 RepID=UPI003F85F842
MTARTVVAVGEVALIGGYRLTGVDVRPAETDDEVRRAWQHLPGSAAVVLLTGRAAQAIGPAVDDPASPLTVVIPS